MLPVCETVYWPAPALPAQYRFTQEPNLCPSLLTSFPLAVYIYAVKSVIFFLKHKGMGWGAVVGEWEGADGFCFLAPG